ncbi:PREDICTED: GTPase IMAP family member 8-like [Cyprinodon variegatus]|uniref:GTPase IMAP family member 8-like n=1 Tax=Cyprinodon variegatus TaxID=28743 RepID=UPI00074262AB|nr:PREDICTED: GTPase IMAP family member 8-like [Cyprinodon variegatus]
MDGEVLGRRVSVVDTAGLCSSRLSAENIKQELEEAVKQSSPGPHVFLLVLQLGRFSKQEQEGPTILQKILGPEVLKHTMILFTYGDRLKDTDINLDQFVREDQNLQKLLKSCSGMYHVLNNNEMENRKQVQDLLDKIDHISGGASKKPAIRMVLTGKTGTGKSTAGNTILGKKCFKSKPSLSSVTSACEKNYSRFNDETLVVVDTPGLFCTLKPNRETLIEMAKCICMAAPGPHVFLVVIQLNRFTEEEKIAVKMIQKWFGEEASKYSMILFTHGDVLSEMGGREAMGGLIKENKALSDFIDQCQGRYHVFDNDEKNQAQVRELLEKINQMLTENGGSYYTNEMFQKAEKANREEMERLLKEHPGMSPEDAREKAPTASKKPEIRMVLTGKTGTGKSAAGNTILGETSFESKPRLSSVTSACEKNYSRFNDETLVVVDTPGLFSTLKPNRETLIEMARCICMAAPGPHVFLVIVQLNRFTEEEKIAVKMIQKWFGEEASKYSMILFTHGDLLSEMGGREAMGRLIKENKALSDFIEKCQGRYHVFDNKEKNPAQVRELLEKINKMLTENGGSYYTNEMFQEAEKANREEMEILLKEHPGMSPEDARQGAEKNNSFIRGYVAAGAGVGAAVGAAVGAGVGGPVGAAVGAAAGAAGGAESEQKADVRVVLVGQERVGKSSAGNTILGKEAFDCQVSFIPVTLRSKRMDGEVLGRRVSVVDTAGLCSSRLSAENIKQELEEAVKQSSPGPHVFLLVLQLGRFSKQEQEGPTILQKILGPEVLKHTMILFTYGDRLKDTDINLDQFVREDQNLQKLLKSCSGMYHVLNNNEMENRKQVQDLLDKIDHISGVLKHTMILFTYGDRLKDTDINLDQFVREDQNLQKLLKSCSGMYHVLNNNEMENRKQVQDLLDKIDHISGGVGYL